MALFARGLLYSNACFATDNKSTLLIKDGSHVNSNVAGSSLSPSVVW